MRSRRSVRLLSLGAFAGFVLAACGGATSSDLFEGPGGTTTDDGGPGTNTNNSSDSGSPSSPGHDAGSPSKKQDAGSPSGGNDSGPVTPPPPSATIDCAVGGAVTTCDAATQVCCETQNGNGNGNGNGSYACTTASACSQQGSLAIPCDNASDCAAEGFGPGTVCCVTEDPNSGVATQVSCLSQADCSADTQTWMCNENGACPAGKTCNTSTTTIPGYKICR